MASDLVVTDGLERVIDAVDTVTWYIQSGTTRSRPPSRIARWRR